MNTLGKTLSFVGGGIALVAVSISATLGIQSWQKDHAIAMAATAAASAPPVAPAAPVPQLAQVIGVAPHFEAEQKTTRHCYPVKHVTYNQPNPTPAQTVAPLVGGALGGLAGSQIGGGHGRDVAIATGATLGALAGKNVQTNAAQSQAQVSESLHCSNQTTTIQVQKGYDVTYLYNGQQGVTRMDSPPVLNSLISPPVGVPLVPSATPSTSQTVVTTTVASPNAK